MKASIVKMAAVSAALAFCAFCWLGCGGGDNGNPADNSGNGNNNNGGDATHDSKLICVDGEAWMRGNCESDADNVVFKSNGKAFELAYIDGVLKVVEDWGTWRTNGNKLIISGSEFMQYDVSDGNLIFTDNGGRQYKYIKCNGLTIVGL